MDAGTLYEILSPVCPILGTSVGDPGNTATWSFAPAPSATQQQQQNATELLAALTPASQPPGPYATAAVASNVRQDTVSRAAVLKASGDIYGAIALLLKNDGVNL